jgi:hypothetical protein
MILSDYNNCLAMAKVVILTGIAEIQKPKVARV